MRSLERETRQKHGHFGTTGWQPATQCSQCSEVRVILSNVAIWKMKKINQCLLSFHNVGLGASSWRRVFVQTQRTPLIRHDSKWKSSLEPFSKDIFYRSYIPSIVTDWLISRFWTGRRRSGCGGRCSVDVVFTSCCWSDLPSAPAAVPLSTTTIARLRAFTSR